MSPFQTNFVTTKIKKFVVAEVKPTQEHAGATLDIPSEEILRKSAQGGKD